MKDGGRGEEKKTSVFRTERMSERTTENIKRLRNRVDEEDRANVHQRNELKKK